VTRAKRSGDLTAWARQGVLLLNTVLTVERGRPASHAGRGWEAVTTALIKHVSAARPGIVFMLWGRHAQALRAAIACNGHLILEAPHPSPLSAARGFFGCGHFRRANEFLAQQAEAEARAGAGAGAGTPPAIEW
jgi:uracil-DNA glycosylase